MREAVRLLVLAGAVVCGMGGLARGQATNLAPAVAVEAEHFTVERGWRVVKMGEGNYAVDIIGFIHAGGERFLSAAKAEAGASAYLDITVPEAGPYHLWVRYEYMPFTDTRFEVVVEQKGRPAARGLIGARDNLRVAFEQQALTTAQYDPPWGNEGLVEELVKVPALEAGPARLWLRTVEQPMESGRTADRHVDFLYLTRDTDDAWRQHYKLPFYRILEAFRDTRGPRYEVRFTNRGERPMAITTSHYYNRNRFYNNADPAASVRDLAPGASSGWLPMPMQDTAHFGQAQFRPAPAQPFTVEVRPFGGDEIEERVETDGAMGQIYLPPYPGQGERAVSALAQLDAVLAVLRARPAPGRPPRAPLNYGWTVPYDASTAYGRRYAQLWAALGMRTYCGGAMPDPALQDYLTELGVPTNRSLMAMTYRNPPTPENIAKAKAAFVDKGLAPLLRRFDYGDEIAFSEWVNLLMAHERKARDLPQASRDELLRPMWQAWLKANRPAFRPADYWRPGWGELDSAALRPDSSADAARDRPRLYVDSVIFYEDSAIAFVAAGAREVRRELGADVLTGANYSGYPFYYPSTTMYVKWFRDGAADFGRHSEYFWQLGQVTPMVNGLFAEYFRAGLRDTPHGRVIQYTMPHSPGNTDASFRRTAFTHLAHGVTMLDYFGMGMNETFTENYIDHRDADRYVAIRDINHAMGLADDVLEASRPVASPVALLASESTERWDFAGIARDFAGHHFGPGFRAMRLTFHQERLGLYKALTFGGCAPDIVIERDLTAAALKGYRVLFLVGDSLPAAVVPALEAWVRAGGVLMASAATGLYDEYREPNPAWARLLGVADRTVTERDRFMRNSQELPFLKPLGMVAARGDDGAGRFPALAIDERFTPAAGEGLETWAVFEDGKPAVVARPLGRGRVIYAAALPGLAYLHTGLTTPRIEVPDRAAGAHRAVNTYDAAAAGLVRRVLAAADVSAPVACSLPYVDTRLIASADGGTYLLPVANYQETVGGEARFSIRPPPNAGVPGPAVSAFAGPLPVTVAADGRWELTVPRLGYGDLVRIDVKR